MGSMSIWHWLIVLLVIALIFGTKNLRNVGNDLGVAVKNFKDSMRSDDEVSQQPKNDPLAIEEVSKKQQNS